MKSSNTHSFIVYVGDETDKKKEELIKKYTFRIINCEYIIKWIKVFN